MEAEQLTRNGILVNRIAAGIFLSFGLIPDPVPIFGYSGTPETGMNSKTISRIPSNIVKTDPAAEL